ncbi:hypothetical protein [Kribbella solani]|uniref:2-polyprenyl-6-methoxyphenol hydroxylase-like FAD-dependent oxidoreductase n=1 Tax=Kribbella solani TaxID=236067 RepID=A0A841DVH7_9ACTN|nr:hypothetical protein [Kribbella solani]MBB5982109.1 2-polyprenyl-6-methoxyphenol hydroxylase-like FAD-dependent oxidoreductase [Kribbella solani]
MVAPKLSTSNCAAHKARNRGFSRLPATCPQAATNRSRAPPPRRRTAWVRRRVRHRGIRIARHAGGFVRAGRAADLGRLAATTSTEAFSGELEILRGDLVDILSERTAGTTEYIFDDSIAELSQDDSGVDVVFAGGVTRRFDLVIGADGLHSNVRRLAFGPESSYVRDLGYYASICTVDNHLGLDHTGQILNVPGKTVGIYSARNNTEAKALFYFASRASAGRYRRCSTDCVPRRTSTSTRSARSSSTATPAAGSRWSVTPDTAPHRCRGWVRAWRSPGRNGSSRRANGSSRCVI